MRYDVGSVVEAETALDYFNGFHDGFILELTLRSHDRFQARGVHEVSGRLDLRILFAHYNYRDGEPPADQLVDAHFLEVRDVAADFPLWHGEWAIIDLRIEPAMRRFGSREERCLAARVLHHRLVDGQWQTCEGLSFTFRRAELKEVEP
jgi:hypothetical protein